MTKKTNQKICIDQSLKLFVIASCFQAQSHLQSGKDVYLTDDKGHLMEQRRKELDPPWSS